MKTDNELIAEFMGFTEKEISKCDISFDSDWNLLMSVVERIATVEKLDVTIQAFIGNLGWQVFNSLIDDQNGVTISFVQQKESGSLMAVTYQSVINFIKWHNAKDK
jgi:hypothetical protein